MIFGRGWMDGGRIIVIGLGGGGEVDLLVAAAVLYMYVWYGNECVESVYI